MPRLVPPRIKAARNLRRKRGFFTLANFARMLLVPALVTELGLRVVGLGHPVLYTHEPAEAQGGCGYFLAPDQDTSRFFERNQTNHWGMRSANLPDQKDPSHYRVLFIGDSVTYGTTFVDQSAIFTSLLQRELPALAHQPVDVLNASAGGWAPSNEVNFLCSHGTYDADLVIFVLNTADLSQPFNTCPDSCSAPTARPATAVGEACERYLFPRLFSIVPHDAGSTPTAVSNPSEEHALDCLEKALAFCSQHKTAANHFGGVKMAITFSPAHSAVWDQPSYETLKQNLVTWCAAQHVAFLDLAPALQPPYDTLYFGSGEFIHLRPAGHRLVADAIERAWPELTR